MRIEGTSGLGGIYGQEPEPEIKPHPLPPPPLKPPLSESDAKAWLNSVDSWLQWLSPPTDVRNPAVLRNLEAFMRDMRQVFGNPRTRNETINALEKALNIKSGSPQDIELRKTVFHFVQMDEALKTRDLPRFLFELQFTKGYLEKFLKDIH